MEQRENPETAAHISAILEQTPNGVLLVDKDTCIKYVNPAFRKMFHCGDEELLEQRAAKFVHSDCFERTIAAGGQLMVKGSAPEHNVHYRVGLFPIEGEDLYCGIFIDISAQEIALLLGETTAETKVLLVKLMSLFEEGI
jgi:PAS domain S-box-containing protein